MKNTTFADKKISDIQELIFLRFECISDPQYAEFQASLIPNIAKKRIIGVRMPDLRRLAREIFVHPDIEGFITSLPHTVLEEDLLHGILISDTKDLDAVFSLLDSFLPYIDNWAVCDLIRPAIFKKHPAEVFLYALSKISSDHVYTVRFGIEMLMLYCQTPELMIDSHEAVVSVSSNEYYINMMIGWYFATALAVDYDATLPYIKNHRLAPVPHKMTIRKACESHRITPERKDILKAIK